MKRRILLILLALTMVFSLTACNGSGNTSTASSAAPAPSQGSADSSTAEPAATPEIDWPKNNITMIMTHGAGGDTDYNGRLISRMLEKELGVSVVVNNVTGSNGAIALSQYKDETPDGYTFILTNTAALTGNEATGLSDFGYDAFEPVCIYGKQSGENIVVPADSPYETLQDLIDASKAAPNTIKFGISTGGGVYIASVILEQSAGAQFAIMESGDGAARMTELLGGHVDATIVPYATAKEYIEAGQIKTLCTLLSEPPDLLDGVPAASESGCPDLVINTLYVCLAPKGTDPAVVQALNDAILDIVNNNEEYKSEVNSFNLQEPWALNVEETIAGLQEQRDLFMKFKEFLV